MATTEEVNEYMMKKMKFIPRMYQVINQVAPDAGMAFANFYQTAFGDGEIPKKLKELMFVAIGITHAGRFIYKEYYVEWSPSGHPLRPRERKH